MSLCVPKKALIQCKALLKLYAMYQASVMFYYMCPRSLYMCPSLYMLLCAVVEGDCVGILLYMCPRSLYMCPHSL